MEINTAFNEELIELVQNCAWLYDKQHKRYFDIAFKNASWKEIATKLNRTVEECKTRWKHLREVFVRKSKPKQTGSSAEEDNWPYFQSMSFLTKFVQPRSTRSNERTQNKENCQPDLQEEDCEYISESPEFICSPVDETPPKKRKRTVESTLKAIEETAAAVKAKVASGVAQSQPSTDQLISTTIMRLLEEISPEHKNKVRKELFQFVFALKEKYGTT